MTGAEWIAQKINSPDGFSGARATVQGRDVVFLQRKEKPNAHIGVVPTTHNIATHLVSIEAVESVYTQKPTLEMMVAIPLSARWSGSAMRWLQSRTVAFGGVGDLMSATLYDEDMSSHRNKTFAFVDDGLNQHTCVADLHWIDSKKVEVRLVNGHNVTVALEDAYDITMNVARNAARVLGKFDILLKTNPNGSITSSGEDSLERLGFQTMKWGGLLGHLARKR